MASTRPAVALLLLTLLLAGCGGPAAVAASSPAAPTSAAPASAAPSSASKPDTSSAAGSPRPNAAASSPVTSSSATSAPPSPVASGKMDVVNVGDLGLTSDGPTYVAIARGYFAEQNIQPKLTRFDSGAAMTPALATGQLDVGPVGTSAGLFNAMLRNVNVRVVADNQSWTPGHGNVAYMVRTEDLPKYKSFADFKGKKLGINATGTLISVELGYDLKTAGLSIKDVDLKLMGFPDMLAALTNKSIDVAAVSEPLVTRGIAGGKLAVYKWMDATNYPGKNHEVLVLLYSPRFASQRANVAARYMTAYIKALRYMSDAMTKGIKKQQWIDAMVKYSIVKDPRLYDKMNYPGMNVNGEVNPASLTTDINWYVKNGFMKRTLDINKFVD
ncbi:MAG: ABC transporter substrate-binding protein, partial [Chloroflexota bacterium]